MSLRGKISAAADTERAGPTGKVERRLYDAGRIPLFRPAAWI